MKFVADLHIHSRFAYACSKSLSLPNLASAARTKGIDVLATGDFTHPAWLGELERMLTEVEEGTYEFEGTRFVLGTEVSCVYRAAGKSRRLHLLIYLSSLEAVRRFNSELSAKGAKLEGDGRPMLALSAEDTVWVARDTDPKAVVMPAHIWTPWYGMLGSVSGFDSLEECFGGATPLIQGVETGLSSDPAMNWDIPELKGRAIVSFSDAHSLPNLGRELTVFRGEPSFGGFSTAIESNDVAYTVEFYPEEGKYHYNGHRKCEVSQSPQETSAQGDGRCPVCGRPLTLGVLHRTRTLAEGPGDASPVEEGTGPGGLISSTDGRPPFLRLVPLEEVLAEALGVGRRSKRVQNAYSLLCAELGSELEVLSGATAGDIERVAGEEVAKAVLKARAGEVTVVPGYDGQYGTVRLKN